MYLRECFHIGWLKTDNLIDGEMKIKLKVPIDSFFIIVYFIKKFNEKKIIGTIKV